MKKEEIKKNNERFYYNIELEMALRQVFGKKYYHSAELFAYPKYVKEDLIDWIKRIRKRTIDITNYDLRLREMIFLNLECLENEVKKIDKENVDWKIIARLMNLVSRFLGYDWCNGEINRHVLFFQDGAQEWNDKLNKGKFKSSGDFFNHISKINKALLETIEFLEKKGLTLDEISSVLKISESTISRLKKKAKE